MNHAWNTVCIMVGCLRTAHARGLCHSCFRSKAKLVRSHATTWIQLVAEGQALPRLYQGVEERRLDALRQ